MVNKNRDTTYTNHKLQQQIWTSFFKIAKQEVKVKL